MSHKVMEHRVVRSVTVPFAGPVSVKNENPAAHGGVCEVEYCECGAQRECNLNGGHQEIGEWDMPHVRTNVRALAATVEDCRHYLEIAAGSVAGRRALEDVLGPDGAQAVIEFPRRGDEKSTLHVAHLVHARLG